MKSRRWLWLLLILREFVEQIYCSARTAARAQAFMLDPTRLSPSE
ncbi:MAG: hypothetical protein P8189_23480 [Anaerolineae bacterium]